MCSNLADVERYAHEVIGTAIEAHRVLGPGFLESVYEEALDVEMKLRGMPFQRQVPFTIHYKKHDVGEGRLDFLVGGCLVVELKTVDAFGPIHMAQVLSYLKATGHTLGLLINFNVPILKNGVKRIILSPKAEQKDD